jgi:5-methyltetrahydrofolate--homocysteine methyltransferase
MTKTVIQRIKQGAFLMDGAMGTQLQAAVIPPEAWQGREGCNELLCVTAPDVIRTIHTAYLNAGSDAVETNSFGASPLTLGEYDLAERARELNCAAARVAREAADACSTPERPRFVFGSIGPGTRLPTLGQVSFDDLCDAFQVQIEGLAEGGVHGVLFETCQDVLQIKAGLAAFDKVLGPKTDIALYVSVTVEQTGTLLIGSNIGAVTAALAPYPVDLLGLNCATGPEAMRIHLDYLAENWPGLLACMPNAGMPEMKDGEVTYPLQAEEFGRVLGTMAREVGLHVVGGCCGTSPAHLAALARELDGFCAPLERPAMPEQAGSVFSAIELTQQPPPLYVGERANATGSKKFRETLLSEDYDAAFNILVDQEERGAHVLDLSCAYAGRDEMKDLPLLAGRAARECRAPLMIDSTQPDVMEAALKQYGGRALINSVNFEAGEERAARIVDIARRYGAGLVCLTIDEEGMAMTADRKLAVARRLVEFCEARGLHRGSLLIDSLTFTVGSGDDSLRNAALETEEGIRRIKKELPGVRTILGLSNISFGLKGAGRKVLNALFLDRCIKAGMDACIINVAAITPLNDLPAEAVEAARALLDNDSSDGDPLENYINFFEDVTLDDASEDVADLSPEEQLKRAVMRGRAESLGDLMPVLLEKYAAEDILNEHLVPAMKEVGVLFNDGVLQLPFVLKSAEVMKRAVDLIKPHMKKGESAGGGGTMVLATVEGDVHDIGKNLVDIILSNNGFKVVNLGTKISVGRMIEAVREHQADVLGMSGLLVKSVGIMAENIRMLQAEGFSLPVFLGGAALNSSFVASQCQPGYDGPVCYCPDAFAGLSLMQQLAEQGALPRTEQDAMTSAKASVTVEKKEPPRVVEAPQPPFFGTRIVQDIAIRDLYPFIDQRSLFRGQWRYRKGKLSDGEYEALLQNEVLPQFERMKSLCAEQPWLQPSVAYGYFHCRRDGDALVIQPEEGNEVVMTFPRSRKGQCLVDFVRPDQDVMSIMMVTLGNRLESEQGKLLQQDHYQDYFLMHGFAVELTEALAAFWHARIRKDWGIEESYEPGTPYVGQRYAFGYPVAPDLMMNAVVADLVGGEQVGIEVLETGMMAPELSTSALIMHHPDACYFPVEVSS